MFKKISFVLLILTLGLVLMSLSVLATDSGYNYVKTVDLVIGNKNATVNGEVYGMDQAAYVKNGRTLVPFRFLAEALGATVTWDAQTGTAVLNLQGSEVKVTVGSKNASINGSPATLDVPAEITGGRTFIPLRFVSEALGAEVSYDSNTKTVTMRFKEKKVTQVADTHEKIRIANVIFNGGPPHGLVMLDKGILNEQLGSGYEVISTETRSIDRVSKEMKEEKYDFLFAYYGTIAEYASNMSEYYNGNNWVVIANVANSPGDCLVAQPGINNVSQLNGKTVGVFNHDYAALVTIANTLKLSGLDLESRGGKVKIRMGNSAPMLEDFLAGKLDALMARASFNNSGFNVLKKNEELAYGGNPPVQVLMVRREFLNKYPDIVEKVLEAHIEATEWIKTNRQETADIVWAYSEKFYKENGMQQLMPDKKQIAPIYDTMEVNVYPNLQFIKDIWDYMNQYNSKKPYPMNEIVNFGPLNKVLHAKGMTSVEDYNKNLPNKN